MQACTRGKPMVPIPTRQKSVPRFKSGTCSQGRSARQTYASKQADLWVKSHMTESIQRILAQRALAGQTPANPAELIEWLETTARAWNADPTPFEWVANVEPVGSALTDGAIHSVVPEPARANQSDADCTSSNNGQIPVK